jgi:catechol 2,3-dioxygenase-like lactoylglutathione lyase family enzyme
MIRLDHIAYRVKDRHKTAEWLMKRWGMKVQTEFEVTHKDGSKTKCLALEPQNKRETAPWIGNFTELAAEYHLPPEVFVSSSDDPNSIVYQWVQQRDGMGGIHHLAFQVPNVYETMNQWKVEDGVKFTTEQPLICPEDGLTQIFSEPIPWLGHIVELITREGQGFCAANVGELMESTRHLSETKIVIDHESVDKLKNLESY